MAEGGEEAPGGWMSDVQRAIAIILIGAFSIITVSATVRMVVSGDMAALNDMAKTLQAAMVNMALIALGFFFGSNMSKMIADAGQQKIVEKLTSTQPGPPAGGPVAPLAGPTVLPWWNALTDDERVSITSSASDAKVAAFIAAAQIGKATPDDLAYLVNAGLLTQARADAIKAT